MHDNVVDQYFFHVSHACGSCTGLSFLVPLLFWFSLSIRWEPDFICCSKKICILNNRGGAGMRHFFKHIYRLSVDNIAHIISRRHSIYAVSKNEKIRVLFWLCPVKQKNGSCFFPSHPTLYIKQIKASDSCLLKHINDPIYPGSAAAILIRKRMAEIQSKQCLFLHAFLLIFFFLSSYTLAGILWERRACAELCLLSL